MLYMDFVKIQENAGVNQGGRGNFAISACLFLAVCMASAPVRGNASVKKDGWEAFVT